MENKWEERQKTSNKIQQAFKEQVEGGCISPPSPKKSLVFIKEWQKL